jgi:hypothetical protein
MQLGISTCGLLRWQRYAACAAVAARFGRPPATTHQTYNWCALLVGISRRVHELAVADVAAGGHWQVTEVKVTRAHLPLLAGLARYWGVQFTLQARSRCRWRVASLETLPTHIACCSSCHTPVGELHILSVIDPQSTSTQQGPMTRCTCRVYGDLHRQLLAFVLGLR